MIITVWAWPPRESFSRRVIFESLRERERGEDGRILKVSKEGYTIKRVLMHLYGI